VTPSESTGVLQPPGQQGNTGGQVLYHSQQAALEPTWTPSMAHHEGPNSTPGSWSQSDIHSPYKLQFLYVNAVCATLSGAGPVHTGGWRQGWTPHTASQHTTLPSCGAMSDASRAANGLHSTPMSKPQGPMRPTCMLISHSPEPHGAWRGLDCFRI